MSLFFKRLNNHDQFSLRANKCAMLGYSND